MPIVTAIEVFTRSGRTLVKLEDGDIFDQLVVHRTAHRPATWTVSHAETGYAVLPNFPSKETARGVARQLLPIADWSQASASGFQQKAMGERVRREVARIRRDLGIEAG